MAHLNQEPESEQLDEEISPIELERKHSTESKKQ